MVEWSMATDSFIVWQRKPDVKQAEVDTLHEKDVIPIVFQSWKSFATVKNTWRPWGENSIRKHLEANTDRQCNNVTESSEWTTFLGCYYFLKCLWLIVSFLHLFFSDGLNLFQTCFDENFVEILSNMHILCVYL